MQLESWVAGVLRQGKGARLSARQAGRQARVIVSSLEGALLLDKGEGSSERLSAVKAWLEETVGG